MKRSLRNFLIVNACCLLPVVFVTLSGVEGFSQANNSYWNEWINFSQKYYKIQVVQNGIYRLDSLTLANAGLSLSGIDPKSFQLFYRGKEQNIYVKGEADGNFNTSDYIEFYGRKNDGSLDSTLYKGDLYTNPVARQPNPYYSLFNDTSMYFLTWNASASNKRITDVNDTAYSSFSPTNYFFREELLENHSNYYYGKASSANINFPEYHEAEGWAGPTFTQGSSFVYNFTTSNVFAGGPNTQLQLAAIGASNDAVVPDHRLHIKYNDLSVSNILLKDTMFEGYVLVKFQSSLPSANLDTITKVTIAAQYGPWGTSRNAVVYMFMKYPHSLNLEGKNYFEMLVPEDLSQPKSFYSFTNFNDPSGTSYVYDLTNNTRIPVTKSGSTYKSLIANSLSGAEKFCVVKTESQYLSPISVKPVRGTGFFIDYFTLKADSAFIIITNKFLRGTPGADAYAAYRSSSLGGSHNVLVVDIEELYDQFGYGIPKHPFAIRHFAEYCADTFPTVPHNLFLIGKSVQTNLGRNTYADPTGAHYANSLVPSISYPVCDNMLVAALNGNILRPLIPIGRLAATGIADITTYLDKVIEYEHPIPDPDEWMKHIIHLSGGKTASEALYFALLLKGYENTLEDTSFGGFVHAFMKHSSSPTSISFTDSIRGLINSGVSLITFFGHSSATVFEFNLLPPDEYDNVNGKYPFMCADGCVAGDIHQPEAYGVSSSEIYVLDQRGMIGFLASSGPGTAPHLDQFSSNFFKHVGQLSYGKSVGKCIQEAIDVIEGSGTDPYINAAALEMTLHCDPSIILHANKLPDYAVSNSSVYFNPPYVSTDLSTFDVNVIVTNIGKATYDSVRVTVRRTFVDGTSQLYSDTLPYLHYKDTLTMTLPVDPIKGPGLNKFEVWVDSLDKVDELADWTNNTILAPFEVPLLIYSGDIIPVYPYKYAIVPNDTIMLKAYTANPFSASARYIFEVDITDLFNSPQKKNQYVTQAGAVVKAPYNGWAPSPLILSDSTVYFWRVRRDTTDTVNYRWRESSYQYISNKRGWGQSHFFQFLKGDHFKYIDTNRIPRYFDMEKQSYSIEVNTFNALNVPQTNVYFRMDPLARYGWTYISPATPHVIVSVLDPVTGNPWVNPGNGPFGSYVTGVNSSNPPLGDEGFEFYTSTSAQQESLRSFLRDVIPCGHKVVLYTMGNHNLGDLIGVGSPLVHPGLVDAFQSIGGTQFPNLRNDFAYIIVGRKCGNAIEKIADADTSIIFVSDTLNVGREDGTIFSETIGPASKWNSLHWRYVSPEKGINDTMAALDTMKVSLLGIMTDGTVVTLLKDLMKNSLDVYNLDSLIDPMIYPYLKLEAWVTDSALRTPAQLTYWRIYYDGVPDASLNPVKHYSFFDPVIQQGDSIRMRVAIENIGDYDMDSLWVDFWVYDANRVKVPIKSMKMDSLEIDSILIPHVVFSTETIPGGLNSLWVEANPFSSGFQQREQHYFNNIGTIPFIVNTDRINPLMDVTFDGVHIMNGDIVSAKPSVIIKLKDENTFLALNDTADFEIYLKRPSQSVYERIYFSSKMTFDPAALPDNSCKINYTPALTDGTYDLKVQAKDRSGNNSGMVEYRISFEVVNKPTVTSVLNYPNPFSTSTKFVFTLTGSEVPDYFKIQIITISGKIVRELNKHDLGSIHIGRNITDYAWDGKDQFGDQLANGLYLYRVITQLDGKSLEHRDSGADPYFTQGYGKMYLIR